MRPQAQLKPTPLIPEECAARYRKEGLWVDQTIPEFLEQSCRDHAHSLAVVALSHAEGTEEGQVCEVRWTYRDMEEAGRRAAARLRAEGVRPGDRVLLQLPNIAEYMAYLLGTFWAGALPVFCLPAHRAADLKHFALKSGAVAHVYSALQDGADMEAVHRKTAAAVEATSGDRLIAIDVSNRSPRRKAFPAPEPLPEVYNTDRVRKSEQVAFLQLSGGTTGVSKLIPRTHADYLYSVRASAEICGLDAESTLLVVLPVAHNFTMSSAGILGSLHAGAATVFAADPSPQTAFKLVERERAQIVQLVPPLAQAWISSAQRRNPDLSSLKRIQIGGAKLARSVAEQVTPVLGGELQQVFGMAEGLVNYTRAEDSQQQRLQTQGRPISPLDELLILDDRDQPVEPGHSGHLLTRGPYTIRGYYDEPAINAKSFTPDGFYITGDIVKIHPSGNLEVTGRAKDQINRNGEKIAVDEIEDVALTHPDIFDAVALGLPDSRVGERICLVVVPQRGRSLGDNARDTVRKHFERHSISPFKIPENVRVMEQLPLTNVGKVSRRDVRAALLDIVLTDKENHA